MQIVSAAFFVIFCEHTRREFRRRAGCRPDRRCRRPPACLRSWPRCDDVGHLDHLGRIEHPQQVGVVAVSGVHGAQERHDRELAALVDADRQAFLAVDVQFDPASAFGNDAAALESPLAAGRFHLADEVDARAAVQLADHDALGSVDDKLTTAEHDRDIAQIDLFLDRLLFRQAQPDLERPPVGEPQLPTFIRLVAGLAQLVPDILQAERLVVAFDREDFPQHALDSLVFSLRPGSLVLQKRLITASLDFRQVRDQIRGSEAAKATSFLGLEPSLSHGGHKGSPSSELFGTKCRYSRSATQTETPNPPRWISNENRNAAIAATLGQQCKLSKTKCRNAVASGQRRKQKP